ncbi:hypothetical protein BC937DRAFT_93560 [Endogone sp. FLAS-F59071]|nr:hypothetical protein BC937DRAFT_93560 [Endogone sp. FLAS-F59071]|eukprot:RUS14615.1 hypothetical protein BC937DRAFT_93560 [Endogone sp. FLAS-F59071]
MIRNVLPDELGVDTIHVIVWREKLEARNITDKVSPPSDSWRDKVRDVQPWVQDVYKRLARVFRLVVNLDSRRARRLDNVYADHFHTGVISATPIEMPSTMQNVGHSRTK